MRFIPATIAAMFATDTGYLARGVAIRLRDGTELGFTDHDRDTTVVLGGTAFTLRSDLGMTASDLDLKVGFETSTLELIVPLRDPVSRIDVMGRRYNQATVWIFDYDHRQEIPEVMDLLKGWVAETWVKNRVAVFEMRSLSDYFNMSVGRVMAPKCAATYGDAQCGVAVFDQSAEVVSVENAMEFSIDLAGTLSDGYFKFGEVEFIGGLLDNVPPVEVYNYTDATGFVELMVPLPRAPQIGDTLVIRQGCSNLKSSDDASIPTCLTNANVINFRGFDQVPGSDVFLRPAIPGEQ